MYIGVIKVQGMTDIGVIEVRVYEVALYAYIH